MESQIRLFLELLASADERKHSNRKCQSQWNGYIHNDCLELDSQCIYYIRYKKEKYCSQKQIEIKSIKPS